MLINGHIIDCTAPGSPRQAVSGAGGPNPFRRYRQPALSKSTAIPL